MKRQSKAEEALRREVKIITDKMTCLREQINNLNQQLMAHDEIASSIENEIRRLENFRRNMSKRNTP